MDGLNPRRCERIALRRVASRFRLLQGAPRRAIRREHLVAQQNATPNSSTNDSLQACPIPCFLCRAMSLAAKQNLLDEDLI